MTNKEFEEACLRVDSGNNVCVKRIDNELEGEVLGYLIRGEAFRVKVKETDKLEVWHRTKVTLGESC